MEGLVRYGTIPTRHTREEFQVLRDEFAYAVIRRKASIHDMQEIDCWARSFYTIEGHLESILQYQKPLLQEPTDPNWIHAKQQVSKEIQMIPRVTSLEFETEFDSVRYEASSAAGYGYPGKKGEANNLKRAKTIANALVRTYQEMQDEHGKDAADAKIIEDSTPDVAFTRTQLAKLPSIKVRNVYGEAFHYILIEGLSALPLLEAFKRADSFYIIGKDPKSYVPSYLMDLDQTEGWFVALDWSSFDATVQLWEIDFAFSALKAIINFPSQLSETAFEIAKTSFCHRKLAAPDGTLWMRHGGIPSGSYFTNMVGSIVNYTRIRYLCNKLGYHILSCRVQGDDSVIKVISQGKPDVFAMANAVAEFGWKLILSKCSVSLTSENIMFLGRHQYQLFNIRERMKILRLMCFPEYEVDDPQISTTRVKMIAKDAGFRDPLYNSIYTALRFMYGEAPRLPPRFMTYVDTIDFSEVNM